MTAVLTKEAGTKSDSRSQARIGLVSCETAYPPRGGPSVHIYQVWHRLQQMGHEVYTWGEQAVPGALQCISGPLTHVLRSQGRADLHFHYEIFATAVTLAALVMGLRWGIEGVAVCYSVSQVLLSPIMCYLAAGLVGMTFGDFWRALRAPLLGTVTMAAVVLVYRMSAVRVAHLSMVPLLCSEVALGVIVYFVSLAGFAPETFSEALGVVKLMCSRTRKSEAPASAGIHATSVR